MRGKFRILGITLVMLFLSVLCYSQPWSPSGTCDFADNQQWNNGGAKGCACTWYDADGNLNCAFGDCGQNALYECVYDCNGHNGYATDQTPRQCDATATPYCWYNGGGGNAGELYCQNIALPIELIEFWGLAYENYNEIHWKTASEFENSHFTISHSSNGYDFIEIIQVDGAGSTTIPQSYYFRHVDQFKGVNYYVLKQFDYNGEYKVYPAIMVNSWNSNSTEVFSDISPNPTNGSFFFYYGGKDLGTAINIKIIDLVGNTVTEGVIDKFNNSQAIQFDLQGLSKGNYLVEITQAEFFDVKRIVVE